jgi:HEAT repeats
MRRLASALRIHPGEESVVLRLLSLMLVAWAGAAIGSYAVESLFFAKFGPRNLPYMYVAVGAITFPVSLAVGALLARPSRRLVLNAIPLAMAVVVLALRGLFALPGGWVYPVTWLLMMVVWIVLGIVTWSLAGTVHDSRQAKRLFPLYGAAAILATAVGGLLTAPLAGWLHAENLVLIWAVSMAATGVLAASLPGGRRIRRRRLAGPRPKREGLLEAARAGASYVRGSELLRWMSVTAALLSLLLFALSLPFAKAVTARYPDADGLAAFLGLFGGATNAFALVVSLAVANRLFARLGVPTVVLGLPAIYLVGFAAVAVVPGFGPLVGLRFAQLVWMNGVWTTGWQALRGVVPPERREQVRAFMDGGPTQAGVIVAGVLLLGAQAWLSNRQFFVLMSLLAAGAVAAGWRVRRSYRDSLVEALREGWPEVFTADGAALGRSSLDQAATATLTEALTDPDPLARRIAMDILAELPPIEAIAVPEENVRHEDPTVRLAALRLIERWNKPGSVEPVLGLLHDPDPEIRAAAADAAVACSGGDGEVADRLRPLLADPNVLARVRAAAALVRSADDETAHTALMAAARSSIP